MVPSSQCHSNILDQYMLMYNICVTEWYFIDVFLRSAVCAVLLQKESSGLFELTLGGIVYVTGVVFFKCDGLIPCAHAIWHCFVFVGAIFHYCAVCKYLLGPANLHTQFLP